MSADPPYEVGGHPSRQHLSWGEESARWLSNRRTRLASVEVADFLGVTYVSLDLCETVCVSRRDAGPAVHHFLWSYL